LFQKSIDGVKKLVGNGFHLWASVAIVAENVNSALLGSLVVLGEDKIADFKTLGNNSVHNHGLF